MTKRSGKKHRPFSDPNKAAFNVQQLLKRQERRSMATKKTGRKGGR